MDQCFDDSIFANYRPVSVSPMTGYIIFIESCNILSDSQYGFRSNGSTALALIDLVEN